MDPVGQQSTHKLAIDVGKDDGLPFPLLMVGGLHFPFDLDSAAPYVEAFWCLIHMGSPENTRIFI
jgi:hypothetical protein